MKVDVAESSAPLKVRDFRDVKLLAWVRAFTRFTYHEQLHHICSTRANPNPILFTTKAKKK